jgi:hypothetical protein
MTAGLDPSTIKKQFAELSPHDRKRVCRLLKDIQEIVKSGWVEDEDTDVRLCDHVRHLENLISVPLAVIAQLRAGRWYPVALQQLDELAELVRKLARLRAKDKPPPLSERCEEVYRLIVEATAAGRGLQGKDICHALDLDKSVLTTHIIPKLKEPPYYVTNKRGHGYFVDHHAAR